MRVLVFLLAACALLFSSAAAQDEAECEFPLVDTDFAAFDQGCGLKCSSRYHVSAFTTENETHFLNYALLAILIPAMVLNVVFLVNNYYEHSENADGFKSTPTEYDALFVVNFGYFLVLFSLIWPQLDNVIRGNHYAAFLCNEGERSLVLGAPASTPRGDNLQCVFGALLLSTGHLLILLYTSILCVNLSYRLYAPCQTFGIQKRYIHACAAGVILVANAVIWSGQMIDGDASHGMCHVSYNRGTPLLVFYILPELASVVVNTVSVIYVGRQLMQQLSILQTARLVADDFANLIHRLFAFLAVSDFSIALVLIAQVRFLFSFWSRVLPL